MKRNTDLHQSAALDRLLSTLLIELDGIGGAGAGPGCRCALLIRHRCLTRHCQADPLRGVAPSLFFF